MSQNYVNLLVKNALIKLSTIGLAPATRESKKIEKVRTSSKKTTRMGFAWTIFGTDEKKQHEIFIGLKTVYDKTSKSQRYKISNSVIK